MKIQQGLAGLLIVQLAITAGLFWNDQQTQYATEPHALLSFEKSAVDKLVVADKDNRVTLKKNAGKWQLPDLHQLPVNEKKLTELLDKLTSESVKWPVTTTASSHERFQVDEDEFQRHLMLYAGDKQVADLYLGTSPGFRKIHVRRADEQEVYSVELNTYELPTTQKDWLDQYLIAAKNPQVITGPDYSLEKSDDSWRFAGANTQPDEASNAAKVDADKASELATALDNLTVTGVADTKPEGVPIVIEVKNGSTDWRYEFIKADDKYYVTRNDQDLTFTLSQYEYDRIAAVRQPQLALKVEEKPAKQAEEKASNG